MQMQNTTDLSPIKLLIAEDFHAETEALLRELSDGDFNFSYVVVRDETGYEKQLLEFNPDVILCPYSLATTNAVKLLGIARKNGAIAPFILLAYDLSEDIAIDLLGEGIEDYILRSTIKRLPVAIRKALQRQNATLQLQLSEAKLKSSETAMRNMVRNAPIAMAMFDLDMNYVVVSERWLKDESKTEEELIGKNHYDIVPEIPDSWKKIHQECLTGATLESEEELIVRADGTEQILRWKMNPWYTSEAVIGGVVLFIEDITSRVLTQVELERSEAALHAAQSIAKIGSWVLNIDDNTVDWSDEMFVIHELEKQAVNVGLIRELTHPEDVPLFDSKFEELVAGNEIEMVYRNILPVSRKIKYFRALGKVSKGPDGIIHKISGTVQEIDERFRTQQELEAKTVQRDLILSSAKIGVWHWTVGSDKLIWDQHCAKIFDEFLPDLKAERYYQLIHPDDRDYVRRQLVEGLKTGEYSAEYRLVKKDTTTFVLSRGRATLDEQGRATHIDGIIIDVTEQHLLEKATMELKGRASN